MKLFKRNFLIILILIMSLGNIDTYAKKEIDVDDLYNKTASYIYNTVKKPQFGQIGGEWSILGLARGGYDVDDNYYLEYYQAVEEYVKKCAGKLHDKKYTEYSRLVLALSAIGKAPDNVAGYDILKPLGDYEKTTWQGINGPIWALIALDCKNYEIPENKEASIQATRDMYVKRILDCQLKNGGWSLVGKGDDELAADIDVTGMALQALSKYKDNKDVKDAIDKALSYISEIQNDNGGFSGEESENLEGCVQLTVALCELGISLEDERFVKNGNTMMDSILSYYNENGGFKHRYDDEDVNIMSTEQCLYALAAVKRFNENKSSLYSMNDAYEISDTKDIEFGLIGKDPDVIKKDIMYPKKTFSDITEHENKSAIEALSSLGIINGKSEDKFEPDQTMTRAEFATIVVRGLGLNKKADMNFSDVKENDWFYNYVAIAYFYGIIKGISEKEFAPYGSITREEAAVMIMRAAKLCGIDTQIETVEIRDILAEFTDYIKASDWAMDSLALCCKNDIISSEDLEIKPKEAIKRAEIAQMLFNMLSKAKLV